MKKINLSEFFVFSVLFALFTVPQFLFSYFSYSLSIGLSITSFFILLCSLTNLDIKTKYYPITLFVLILLIQASYFLINFDDKKPLFSLFVIIYLFFSILFLSNKIKKININFLNIMKMVLFFLIFLGWISIIAPRSFLNPNNLEKFVFPFSEQSHYALAVGFLLIICGYYSNFKLKIFFIVCLFAQALIFPSLTLLQFVLLALVVFFLMKNILIFIFSFFTLVLIFFISNFNLNNDYFSSRLNFNDSDNLSTLVYLQGIDDAVTSLKSTQGLGLGFQRAGTNELGFYGKIIDKKFGLTINREDGGFLAAKLIIEFGFIGLLIVIIYIYLFFVSCLKIIRKKNNLFDLAVVSIFIEMFFRGIGYFSPQILLFLLIYFLSKNKRID